MYRGMLIDPHEACECPKCGGRKATGVELCTSCSQWCPDPNHHPNRQKKNLADELCSSCSEFLSQNESRDRGREKSDGFWVYALWTNGVPYYGHSHDPWVRYDAHCRRLVRSTAKSAHMPAVKFGPWPTRAQAYRIERAITAVLRRNSSWPYIPAGLDGETLRDVEIAQWDAGAVRPIG